MYTKKETSEKFVHKFTQTAIMRFRPQHIHQTVEPEVKSKAGLLNSVSNILGGFFKSAQNNPKKSNNFEANRTYQKSNILDEGQHHKNKSHITPKSEIKPSLQSQNTEEKQLSRVYSMSNTSLLHSQKNQLTFLQKVSPETFLIGNENQLDLISIVGIYQNNIDTDLNWSLSIDKKIKKVAVDSKKMLIAIEGESEIHLYKYDLRKSKQLPVFLNKVRTHGENQFLLFLKDNLIGVFYSQHLQVFQIQDNHVIRQIFNKKYGVSQNLILFQVPKPIENALNIFFKQASQTAKVHTLWRLELQLKNVSPTHTFKSLMRIYDIPNSLMKRFRIDNYSRDTFIMNFQHQIYAAKDGYIVDNVNVNIQEQDSCLIYRGDHLLSISDRKLDLYGFKIITNVKPNKIVLNSIDSVVIVKNNQFTFFDCLQMLNGNFVLFFQIKPQKNRKTKGQIDYLITVTQKLTVAEKLSQIFTFKSARQLRKIAKKNYGLIQQKCDIAFKIGLSRKQVYLELWMRSAKSTVSDYKFLLDTMDYQTIKQQIEKKLKKSSMQFRQVYKLEQSCFDMLRKEVFSPSNCSQQCIKNYIKSHFLLRKLQFYRDIQSLRRGDICQQFQEEFKTKDKVVQKGDHKKNTQIQSEDSEDKQENDQFKKFRLHIDIQQYFNCINLELKSNFLDLAMQICTDNKPVVEQLRIFVRKFKFSLRIVYSTLLQNLIIQSKSKLIRFMKAFPEILPYQYIGLPQYEDLSLFRGLSQPISNQQWPKNLHIEQVTTIYNKQTVNELIKTIWFKRNQFTLHDLIPLTKTKIVEIVEFNSSDAIFYFFIQKIFEHCKQRKDQQQIIFYLESNYPRLPQHLKGRIFLYRQLFNYFAKQNYSSPNITTFNTFLKMQDYELFRQLFRHQKTKKGCLLKDAKGIYAALPDGNEIYKQSLLRYFSSDLSQISDLKCILNRLNNEKVEFHAENEGIYEVLVKAMEIKVKLGTDNDIPLQQVMIYIDNIPLNKESPVIEELRVVQLINEQAQLFKQMKINLSFLEIMQKQQYVVSELLNFFIGQKALMNTVSQNQFMNKTYDILAKVQIVKQLIYKDKFRDLQYFLYLNKLLQHQQMIQFARLVLADPYLQAEYDADQIILQNLVLYMVKWRLQERAYQLHKDYLDELLTILPEENSIRNYILAEAEFAIMLSTPEHPVLYPLAATNSQATNEVVTIRLGEIQTLFQHLDAKFITNLDINRLYELVKQMQHFYEQQIIQIEDIYQIALKRLLELGEVKQAIPLFKKAYSLRSTSQNYSAVFCLLIIDKIIVDIPESHRKNLIKIVFYTFSQPLQLIDIIESRLNTKLSNDQQEQFMTKQIQKVKKNKCYSSESLLLDKLFLAKVKEREDKHNNQFQELIFQTWARVCNNREDFNRSLDYTWIFIILINNPYALSKFLSVKGETLNIRIVRSFLSYVYREQIFNGFNILRFARRAFIISLEQIFTQFTVEYLASQYKGVGLEEEQQIQVEDEEASPLESKLIKSIKAFTKKLNSIKLKPVQPEDQQKKKKRVLALLTSQMSINLEQSQYPFSDSDDNYENDKQDLPTPKIEPGKSKKKGTEKKLLRQKEKNLALYLTNMGGGGEEEIRKTSPRLLKTSLAFHPQFQSVHFSKSKKPRKQSDHANGNKFDIGHIIRTDSIGVAADDEMNDEVLHSMYKSQKYEKTKVKDDFMFASVEDNHLRPMLNSNNLAVMTKSESPHVSNQEIYIQLQSPVKLKNSQSLVNVDIEEEMAQETNLDEQKEREKATENMQFQYNFTVNVQQINDQTYTQPTKLVKQLVEDHADNQIDPMFNISLIIAEKEKQFDGFDDYLKKIVKSAYEMKSKPLSLMLQLIKQIQANFSELKIQSEFLKVYIALQSYNTKYKYNLPIRQMFPIEGIFLQSAQLKALFHFVKFKILQFVDFGHIFVVAKVIHFSFQKSDIKDQLYYSYLAQAAQQYGSDTFSSEEELLMQKERIGGIVEQIILLNILVQRGRQLLGSIEIASRRQEIATAIKEVFRKKKKENLIAEFDKIAFDI